MSDLEARLSQIEERLKITEDEFELRNLMVRYGFAVDYVYLLCSVCNGAADPLNEETNNGCLSGPLDRI
jgi:hypothetical protein